MWRRLTPVVLALVTLPAASLDKFGASFPDQVEHGGRKLVLSGVGLCEVTVFKVKAFAGALYLEQRAKDAATIIASDGPKRFTMRFFHDVSSGALAEQFESGFEDFLDEKAYAAMKPRLAKFAAAMPDVKDGQQLTMSYAPGVGFTVEFQGKVSPPIAGADFAQAFFAGLVGEEPVNDGLRDGLLGR